MDFNELYLLSTYLKKWSFGENRITLNYSFTINDTYERGHLDMRLGSPLNLVNEFLNHVFHNAKELVFERNEDAVESDDLNYNIILVNEPEIKRKLSAYLSKILREFNQNRRTRGRGRMISTRSLDFYYNDFEFEPLSEDIKFYVYLNRGVNKMSGDLWTYAIEDFTEALKYRPEDIQANKYIAKALKKVGNYKDSLEHLRIYAQAENTAESLDALAAAYIHLGIYEKAREVYAEIEKDFPDSPLAVYGKAQLAYKEGKGFKTLLDRIYKKDPEWLQEKLKTEWDYKLPAYCDHEECKWNAAIAARYLGFERPFDLTRRAFNDELPSYFDSEKGTIRFVRAELDTWVELMNRYKLDVVNYKTYEERLTKADIDKAKIRKKRTLKKREEKTEQTTEVA